MSNGDIRLSKREDVVQAVHENAVSRKMTNHCPISY